MDEDYIHGYELDQIMNRFENFGRMSNVNQDNAQCMSEDQKMNRELMNNEVTIGETCPPKIVIKKDSVYSA